MKFSKPTRYVCLAALLGCFTAPVFGAQAEPTEYQLTLEQMRTFTEVFARIKQDYVEPVNDQALIESAIEGMLSHLDPHTAYLDRREYSNLAEGTTGEFTGVGIEVVESDGQLLIVSPIDDTPAAKAGIQAGDIVTQIDGQATSQITLEESVELIRGEPGTELTLTLAREGVDEPFDVVLSRAVIEIESVAGRMLQDQIGYVRISTFQNDTAQNLDDTLKELVTEHGPLKGLVLDLRNNPGGVLHSAVGVADIFLQDGLIVYTEGRSPAAEMRFSADPQSLVTGVPIVVLINAGTASASEIVAGALKDQHRAVLLGVKSFGKGSVQTVLPLGDGNAVKLTTALYYTPSGRSIQAKGIDPDITVRANGYDPQGKMADVQREADLAGHLEVERKPANPDINGAVVSAAEDFQLYQAVNLLKGVNILSRNGVETE